MKSTNTYFFSQAAFSCSFTILSKPTKSLQEVAKIMHLHWIKKCMHTKLKSPKPFDLLTYHYHQNQLYHVIDCFETAQETDAMINLIQDSHANLKEIQGNKVLQHYPQIPLFCISISRSICQRAGSCHFEHSQSPKFNASNWNNYMHSLLRKRARNQKMNPNSKFFCSQNIWGKKKR